MWIVVIIIVLLIIALLSSSKRPLERKENYDDDFGDISELISSRNDGIWIGDGKISRDLSFRHCCVIAPSGGGKTSTVLIPTALELDNCSAIILDPAGELFEKTSGEFERKGFTVKILDFTDPDVSIGFNPLLTANSSTELNILGEALFASAKKTSKDSFWPTMAARLVVLLFKIQKKLPKPQQTLANTLYLLNILQGDPRKIDQLFVKYADDKLFAEYKALVKHDQRLLSSILATAQSSLGIFDDEAIALVTSKNTLDFKTLRNEKMALFIHIPVTDAKYLSFLAEIYFAQLFRFCMSHTVTEDVLNMFIIGDELGSLTIQGFPEAMANLRKYSVSITFAIQSKSQLIERYGKQDAETIYQNSYSKIIFGGMEIELAKEFEKRMGKWTFVNENGKEGVREVMTASELVHLPEGSAFYVPGPNRPTILEMHPYYENSRMTRKANRPPAKVKGDAPKTVSYIEFPELKIVPKVQVVNG
ncbi:MAG: type IV secretory system conjugative DNA transfer family protein [Bacteroidia bacterium]